LTSAFDALTDAIYVFSADRCLNVCTRERFHSPNDNPGADLIRFAPAARDGTITLTSGQLSITDDLILDGPGVNRLTISGNDASRVFGVSGGATDVEIRDLTIPLAGRWTVRVNVLISNFDEQTRCINSIH